MKSIVTAVGTSDELHNASIKMNIWFYNLSIYLHIYLFILGPLPPGMKAAAEVTKDDSEASDDEEEQEESMVDKIPRSHEIKLNHSDKAITSLSLDPSGMLLAWWSRTFRSASFQLLGNMHL